jgi:UDP-N-acetylmuramate: L-alanyl-gamma-D-glutamyl-meso-diaminopimelate ligase
MGSLAGLLAARGIRITGSDDTLYPPMSTMLEQWGIPVHSGFRPEHVLDPRPDLVVIGNAVRPDNPEARAAIDEGLPYLSFPDALYRLAIAGKHPVVVSGTHGKTTTTSLLAALLHGTGRDPSLLVGGYSHDFEGSFREGQGDHFVVEGDEYDTAFFDKTPKFLHYGARTLLITSVEFDHADIYRDLDHIKEAFRKLVESMPKDGTIVAAVAHPGVRDVISGAPCRVVGYGVEGQGLDWSCAALETDSNGTHFDILIDDKRIARDSDPTVRVFVPTVRDSAPTVQASVPTVRAFVPMFGRFNVENALGALAAATTLGVPLDAAKAALSTFKGVKRRQELRGEERGVAVVDDFAHHPTAVRGSIGALRERFAGRRLIAVFEPRTNTNRRAIFQQDYAQSFDDADQVIIRSVAESPLYSATGPIKGFFSPEKLVADLGERGVPATALDRVEEIIEQLTVECRSGDVVLCMSNGSFDNIWQRLLDALRDSAETPERQSEHE